jgi:aryl-phospho-beta-D-glucosidase BglC (GH1 family)
MKMNFLKFFLLLIISNCLSAQDIFELNAKLGRGVNMGNMFEAPSEEAWGNPFKDDYFERIAGLGFNHVRIPITWDVPARTLQVAPYTINAEFMARIKYVVDKAQKAGLMAIINMHHHEDIFANPDAAKAEFLGQWKQIAETFKDYDNRLLFEPLNEPHGNLKPEQWNTYFADALSIIREKNPNRGVIMGIANYGGLSAVPEIVFPKEGNKVILSIHYYEPFHFTHQGAGWVNNSSPWLGTKWTNTDLEQKTVKSQFQFAINFAKEHNVPINIGEFGAYSTADMDSRVLWTTFLARWFEEQGLSWAYWEFSSGFGFFNPVTKEYNQRLVDALLKNPLPEPVITKTTVLYESDFTSGLNGWSLATQGAAKGTFIAERGKAKIVVSATDTDAWKVQFVKNNVALKKGKRYLVSFKAEASTDVSSTSYIGQSSDPWGAYSGYSGISIGTKEADYQYGFEMKGEDDAKARFVFDLGKNVGTIFFRDLKVEEVIGEEEVVVEETVLAIENADMTIHVYPNPTSTIIKIELDERLESYQLYNLKGALIQSQNNPENNTVFLKEAIPAGTYILKMMAKGNIWTKRVMVLGN